MKTRQTFEGAAIRAAVAHTNEATLRIVSDIMAGSHMAQTETARKIIALCEREHLVQSRLHHAAMGFCRTGRAE